MKTKKMRFADCVLLMSMGQRIPCLYAPAHGDIGILIAYTPKRFPTISRALGVLHNSRCCTVLVGAALSSASVDNENFKTHCVEALRPRDAFDTTLDSQD